MIVEIMWVMNKSKERCQEQGQGLERTRGEFDVYLVICLSQNRLGGLS